MTGLPECFTKKQLLYHGNKLQLLKIFDPTPSLTSTPKKDADENINFVENLSSGCSPIDILCDSYFDTSLKSHTCEARGCGQFFPFKEGTNIPNDFQANFLRRN